MGKTAGLHVQKKDGFVWIKLPDSLNMDNYVKVEQEVGANIYFDPKGMAPSLIPRRYRNALAYGRRHCPEKIKSGWN